MYLVYEKNYGLNDVDCVEESEFALFHSKEKALQDMQRRKEKLLEDESFSFIENKSDETCLVMVDCPVKDFVEAEVHICLTKIAESDLRGKKMTTLLQRVVEWVLQDSSELTEAKRKLEEIGFSKTEYEALGFPEMIEEETKYNREMQKRTENTKLAICRMLAISIDHASPELLMDIENNGLTNKLGGVTVYHYEYGWLTNKLGGVTVYHYEYGYEIHMKPCNTEEEWEKWLAGIDPRLHRMLRIAHENQCNVLRLDSDGPVVEDLEVF